MLLFKLSSEVRTDTLGSLNSIDKKLLYIPKFNTVTYGKESLRYVCPFLWNEIFKTGIIEVNNDKKKNIPVTKIKTVHNSKMLYRYSLEQS